MLLPMTTPQPPFAITRSSHVRLQVTDLGTSRDFYRDVIGLVVSEETDDVVYFRGWEEAAHHSLVLERGAEAKALQIGLRVREDADIIRAERYFRSAGIPYERVELPHQGPTIRFVDPVGTHMELTSSMALVERRHQRFAEFVAGAPQRIDHHQVVTRDVQAATDFWAGLGMRLAEYTATDGTDELWGSWMEVKGNTHDLVFTNGLGPRLHHFANTISPTPFRTAVRCCMPPTSRATSASGVRSTAVPAGTASRTRCSSTYATPTSTVSNCSRRTTSSSTWKANRCAGTSRTRSAPSSGVCLRPAAGSSKPASSPVNPFMSRF